MHHQIGRVFMRSREIIAAALALGAAGAVRADVKLNHLFTPGAVLQHGMPLPVWGTARDGEKITVELAGHKGSATARNGKWMVRLSPIRSNGETQTLTVRGDNTVTVPEILIGEVW